MSDATSRLDLPWLMPAQAQKHVTVNHALERLDALIHPGVESRTLSVQPETPEEGAAWILPAGASGEQWGAFTSGAIAFFRHGAWSHQSARAGFIAFVQDEGMPVFFDGTQWLTLIDLITALSNLQALGVGTAPDAANPFAAKLNAALWTALSGGEGGTGDLRYTLNKEGASNILSMLFQSGWSGRAELGLTGSDDFSLKVSPDGASWTEALKIDRMNGLVRLAGAEIGGEAVYHRGNLVGIVSESGGAPSGAVIERGANGDGEFVRFADGTQICWRMIEHDLSITGFTSYDFPASFHAVYPISASISGDETAPDGVTEAEWRNYLANVALVVNTQTGARWRLAAVPAHAISGAMGKLYLQAAGRWH